MFRRDPKHNKMSHLNEKSKQLKLTLIYQSRVRRNSHEFSRLILFDDQLTAQRIIKVNNTSSIET